MCFTFVRLFKKNFIPDGYSVYQSKKTQNLKDLPLCACLSIFKNQFIVSLPPCIVKYCKSYKKEKVHFGCINDR